jgi:hypothetical protein
MVAQKVSQKRPLTDQTACQGTQHGGPKGLPRTAHQADQAAPKQPGEARLPTDPLAEQPRAAGIPTHPIAEQHYRATQRGAAAEQRACRATQQDNNQLSGEHLTGGKSRPSTIKPQRAR